jgi:cyclophilin family peptidyl-prolyl cis-trans isomerase/HEAT repeat protein
MLAGEARRDFRAIATKDLQTRDVRTRRGAARALARIGGDASHSGLIRLLADEDDEVVAWAAFGLGAACRGHDKVATNMLVARGIALARARGAEPEHQSSRQTLDPVATIARALGRCGSEDAETTLVAWLTGPHDRAVAAAFALGTVATARQKLREETLAALLNRAAGSASETAVPEAIYPLGRLDHLPVTVIPRVREVASSLLSTPGEARVFAVRALGRGGDAACADLARVLGDGATFTVPERVEAVRALERLGRVGQESLVAAATALVPPADPAALTSLIGDELSVFLSVVQAMAGSPRAEKILGRVSRMAAPPSLPASIARRLSLLRCAAAKTLAGSDFRAKGLTECDVTSGPTSDEDGGAPSAEPKWIGTRAVLEVVGRGRVVGARLDKYRALARSADVRVREAAVALLEDHPEIDDAANLLAEGLAANEPGVVVTAASVIANRPQRAMASAAGGRRAVRHETKAADDEPTATTVAPPVVKALEALLRRDSLPADPELAVPVMEAVAALALKQERARLEELCRSPYPTIREHAAKALDLVSDKKRAPPAALVDAPLPEELTHLVTARVTLELETDAGALSIVLHPELSPVAVTRLVDLAAGGYYDGTTVHRTVSGFVEQLGARYPDGFGGAPGKPPLRCETAPVPFGPLSVGIALTGRDTGTSQFFVVLTRSPQLDGDYTVVGEAVGPWGSLSEGDIVTRVRVTSS